MRRFLQFVLDCIRTFATLTAEWCHGVGNAGVNLEGSRVGEAFRSSAKSAAPMPARRPNTNRSDWHDCHFTNGPTEAMNNLIKRVKRAAFGFTSFRNYRIRSLLYAGKPNWNLLATIRPH
jgi:transposase